METLLQRIFNFISENRIYNKELQTRYYSYIINSQHSKFENIVSLLYEVANTQSQPRIDYLAEFYKKIYANQESVESFANFVELINQKKDLPVNYSTLFAGMKKQKGWGNKTSALFAKSIFHLLNKQYPKELEIWNDVPKDLTRNDQFYLPVDAVIIAIFKCFKNINWSFGKINRELERYYSIEEIEVWDDLWFWGFITQSGSGNNRKMEWNLNKYWTLRESDKNPEMIEEIRQKAKKFLTILNTGN